MARVTSEKTRQFRFVVDDAMEDGIPVDNIALFLPDGTPIDLTADPSKMKWLGSWSAITSYVLNDVVLDTNDNGLYIVTVDTIIAGQPRPSTPNASWQLIFKAPPGGGFKGTFDPLVSYPIGSIVLYQGSLWGAGAAIPSGGAPPNELPDAINVTLGIAGNHNIARYTGPWTGTGTTGPDPSYRYFDLTVGGVVTFPGPTTYAGWTGAGVFTYSNFSGAKTLTAGRWIFSAQGGPNTLALSGGAVMETNYPPNWTLLVKNELPSAGAQDDILVKASTTSGDVKWATRPEATLLSRGQRLSATPTLGRLWTDTDTGYTWIGDGSNWVIWNPRGFVRRTSDFTLPQSDTTISGSGDVVMSFPQEAPATVLVEGLLRLQGVSNLADIKIDFGLSSGSYEMLSELDALGVPAGGAPVAVSTGTPLEFGLINGIVYAKFTAILTITSFAQTVNFRAAQVTSQAENVKILTNSVLKLTRLV